LRDLVAIVFPPLRLCLAVGFLAAHEKRRRIGALKTGATIRQIL
jgi:hypothetical protein